MASPKLIIQKANAFPLKPNTSYVFHVPGIEPEETELLKAWLEERSIKDVLVVSTETLNISELPENPNVVK